MFSTTEFIDAEINYRQKLARAAWRAGTRPRRVRNPHPGPRQPR
jgi:hypothetical protein